ncbi:MAG: CoA-binding protein [Gemmatimonadetes bacterium]|nr:acetate--CoA ligase family protein [Gemmatimonadota bacterium]NNM05424.1 CoA-binding protein [Gemmatimonadota bacterium]
MEPSLDPLFNPEAVAVIGASRNPGTIGYQIVDNLVSHGYQGVVYPVNPYARAIHSLPAYPSISEVPGPVDLAVVVVPKEFVLKVVDECGDQGVKAVVVISAGFREVGGEGRGREEVLLEIVRRHGMRLVGPNCMGVMNTSPAVRMNATFAPTMPPAGATSFLSQSGALGVTILDYAAEYGIGIRQFVSIGNKPDVSGNDLLEYWEDDEGTRLILMYLESFGNPKNFIPLARRISRKKPIAVVKSGRTAAGARAASSHTGALVGTDLAIDSILAQCGVLRAESIEELFDLAMAFEDLQTPAGNRVAIVTNAGGPGIIIADTCESAGLDVVELAPKTQARLRGIFPAEASVRNPVDMIASATGESYEVALRIVLDDPRVDAAIAAFVPPLGVKQADIAASIVAAVEGRREKPVLAVLMGREGLPQGVAELNAAGIPAYRFPESAARALAAMHQHRSWADRPLLEPEVFEVDRVAVEKILDGVEDSGRTQLTEIEALQVFRAYGIPTIPFRVANSEEEAIESAEEVGFPVVLKVLSPDVVHKTDAGGVQVDLRSAEEVAKAYRSIMESVQKYHQAAQISGVIVETYEKKGREVIIGMSSDSRYGPILMFGLGGIYVEALRDVAFRVHPVTRVDAEEMIRAIRGLPLLEGVRGEPGVDLDTLSEVIQRVSQLVGDHDRIEEMDLNPFLAVESGGMAVDARMALRSE